MNRRRHEARKRLAWISRWVLGLGLVFLVGFSVHWNRLGEVFGQANWLVAVPGIVALIAVRGVAGWTWWLLLRRFANGKPTIGAVEAVRVFYIAEALGSLTPMNVGNDLYRAHVTRSWQVGLRQALAPIVLQRLTSSIGIVVLGGLSVLALPLPVGAGRLLALVFAGLFAAGLVMLGLPAARNGWGLRKLGLPDITPRALAQGTLIGLALGLAFNLLGALLACVMAMALAADLPFPQLLAAILLARATILIPISVNGLGFTEGSLALLFPLVRGTPELGLGVALLQRVSWLVTIVVGAGLWMLGAGPARPETPPPGSEKPPEGLPCPADCTPVADDWAAAACGQQHDVPLDSRRGG